MRPFRRVLGISVGVILVVGALEWAALGWPIRPPLLAAAFFAFVFFCEPDWPRTSAFAVLPFCILAPTGAWSAFAERGHQVLLVPLFDTVFAAWILASAVLALRRRRSRGSVVDGA